MTSISLCKVVMGYSLEHAGNKTFVKLLHIIACHNDITSIIKNSAQMLKRTLSDTRLYVLLDKMMPLPPYYYVKKKREVKM